MPGAGEWQCESWRSEADLNSPGGGGSGGGGLSSSEACLGASSCGGSIRAGAVTQQPSDTTQLEVNQTQLERNEQGAPGQSRLSYQLAV